jgi:hypothetical protein
MALSLALPFFLGTLCTVLIPDSFSLIFVIPSQANSSLCFPPWHQHRRNTRRLLLISRHRKPSAPPFRHERSAAHR